MSDMETISSGEVLTRTNAIGAVCDAKTGRIISNPAGGVSNGITNPEQARALATKRWSDYHAAAEDGVARGTRKDTSVLGWGYIVERQSQLAIDIDKGRASTEAARFVRDGLGLSQGQGDTGSGVHIDITGEAVQLLVDAMLAWQERG